MVFPLTNDPVEVIISTMKRILIIEVKNLSGRDSYLGEGFCLRARLTTELHQANLVFLRAKDHFRCIKNRWDETSETERIPNFLLKDYILRYKKYFTKEELINTIIAYVPKYSI